MQIQAMFSYLTHARHASVQIPDNYCYGILIETVRTEKLLPFLCIQVFGYTI